LEGRVLALILAVSTALPANALVPITQQCPALHATWDPLFKAASASAPRDAQLGLVDSASSALRTCRNKIRQDEQALALMLLGDLSASFGERIAIVRAGADPASVHHQYWGLYDQTFDDAQHFSKFLDFKRSQQCGNMFVDWIRGERDALERGTDPVRPLLAMSSYTDDSTRQCVSEVTGWQIPSPQKA
jgi:hypothetical protein